MNRMAQTRYDAVARLLHWLIGLAIIFALVLGLGHDGWKDIPWIMPVHKATGMTILALSLFRLIWRLAHPAPALPTTIPNWQVSLAHGLHWLFYFMMIAVPITGWIFSSAGKYPLEWFGLFDIPKLPVMKDSALAEAAHEGHEVMGKLFIPLLALHVGVAFYHHFAARDDVLRRML